MAIGIAVALSLALSAAGGTGAPAPTDIVVATSSSVEAYREALEGLRRGLGKLAAGMRVVELDRKGGGAVFLEMVAHSPPPLIVTIGSEAASFVASHNSGAAVVSTMTLRHVPLREGVLASVSLDVPLTPLLEQLKAIFPGRTRLGIIRTPATAGAATQPQSRARELGFVVTIAECGSADKLLDAFLSLKDAVDFVWCVPDTTLFNTATFKPLILASLRSRLPIIGFSEYFVRAGAAVGVYPDSADIGSQTAEIVRKYLETQKAAGAQVPRKLRVAINQNVSRMLGLRWSEPAGRNSDLVIVR